MSCTTNAFTINKQDVKNVFIKVNVKKYIGPDVVCSNLLKVCAPQLCQVFSALFTWSLKDSIVPGVWKISNLSDYIPTAITSVVMKCFQKIVLQYLLDLTKGKQNPFWLSCRP